ncbi:phospholipase D-like domain-containing protein [Polaromonas naphthalenivorans]|uniref:PLD phosphodiesterase domain-containing protein n=1 Tax=Polaromonas naphthalenivorans (strain CJ2) TaxID=365044 RepID=A1VV67_POLNA|nr:hypothetical protein [Polaromonas naphthalenivorans]ABM39545.1 hypothetical protein Pnap_4262 [Polaromonas naphthalenivorans CJ2]
MKLYEAFAARGYHTSVVTTFGIDFDTYENVALARLRGNGCTNNLLLADHRMLALALENPVALPRLAGRFYSLTGVRPEGSGVYHPKILLQIGRTQGRLVIGSANMTAAGLSGNLEVTSEIICDESESPEQAALVAAWRFVLRHADRAQSGIERQISWTLDRAHWLKTALNRPHADGPATPRFFSTGSGAGIATRFAEAIGPARVKQLIVVSPYWDSTLQALDHLVGILQPESVITLIQKDMQLFPGPQAGRIPGLRVIDLASAGVKPAKDRFVHAKIIIAQTADADHVLAGSANCTVAAMGNSTFAGTNEEASLYQLLPAGSMIESLGLQAAMSAQAMSSDELANCQCVMTNEIALDEGERLNPGRFELDQMTLFWWPTKDQDADVEPSLLQLFDIDGQPLAIALLALPGSTGTVPKRFRLGAFSHPPRFAAVHRLDGTISGLAVINWADQLQQAAREVRRGPTERALQDLDGEEDEGLWLLDVIDTLEAAERAERNDARPVEESLDTATARSMARHKPKEEDLPASTAAVAYDLFIAGRRAHADEFKVTRSSLGGSELSAARIFLNRLLKSHQEVFFDKTEDNQALETSLTDKSQTDREGDEDQLASLPASTTPMIGSKSIPEPDAEREPEKKQIRKTDTPQDYARSVMKFTELCKKLADSQGLGSAQALKLRILLSVIAGAGTSRSERTLAKDRKGLHKHQILPADGDEGWMRLIGILLFTFFGQSRPLARAFQLDASLEQVPDDFLEVWATCFWVAIARSLATVDGKTGGLDEQARKFADLVYRLTALRPDELRGEIVLSMLTRLNERYAARLGVDGNELLRLHGLFIQA